MSTRRRRAADPGGRGAAAVGPPTVVGATACGLALAAVRTGSGFHVSLDLPAGAPLVVLAATAVLVLVGAPTIVTGA